MSGFGYINDGKTNMRVYIMLNTFKKTYVLPFKYVIPHYTKDYLENTSNFKRFSKFVRRFLFIFFSGQSKLEQQVIQENQKNILWINLSAPSLGDSLMDVSSRILLEDKNVDLYTDKKNGHIYADDKIFQNIITDENLIERNSYDLVIIDSYSTRSLKVKIRNLRNIPFVGMYGYYNGPEVNRVLYSFHQMNHLLGYTLSEKEINETSKANMYTSNSDQQKVDLIDLPSKYVCIVLGGEWDYRTYNGWDKVIAELFLINQDTNVVFVGSSNATQTAVQLTQKFDESNIINCVAKYSFCQTAEIIKRADVVLCCDGGLMHASNAVGTTIIPLFARLTPTMQLTNAIESYALFDKNDVNNIDYKDIVTSYCEYFNIDK